MQPAGPARQGKEGAARRPILSEGETKRKKRKKEKKKKAPQGKKKPRPAKK
jgi:hypothetical protein